MIFDPTLKLEIDIAVLRAATSALPEDFEGILGDHITDDHRVTALREVFREYEDYSEDLLPTLLKSYRETEEVETRVRTYCDNFFGAGLVGRF